MLIEFSPFVLKELKRTKRRDRKLAEKIIKQLSVLKSNPQPSILAFTQVNRQKRERMEHFNYNEHPHDL